MLQDFQTNFLRKNELWPAFRILETYIGTDTTHTARLTRALQMNLGINERTIKQECI